MIDNHDDNELGTENNDRGLGPPRPRPPGADASGGRLMTNLLKVPTCWRRCRRRRR